MSAETASFLAQPFHFLSLQYQKVYVFLKELNLR